MSIFETCETLVYDSTFDTIYDSLIKEYKSGKLTVEQLEKNIEEQQQILLNSLFEAETKSAYCNAIVDAHQFVLALINNGKITFK